MLANKFVIQTMGDYIKHNELYGFAVVDNEKLKRMILEVMEPKGNNREDLAAFERVKYQIKDFDSQQLMNFMNMFFKRVPVVD